MSERGEPMTAATSPDQPRLVRGRTALRPSRPEDCDFISTVETHPDNAPYIEQWSPAQHRAAMAAPGSPHWVLEFDRTPIGYALLEGADDPNHSLLLRRIAIASKGRGHGRSAIILLSRYCFDVLRFHRLWLYVAVDNRRALGLYRRLGFVQEGIARECSRHGSAYHSMYILSLLEQEYRRSPAVPRDHV